MKDNPGASSKTIASRAKQTIVEEDTFVRVEHCRSLIVQGQMLRQFEDRAPGVWPTTVTNMPEHLFKFAMNVVTDALPHNANLDLWGKKASQTASCAQRGRSSTTFSTIAALPLRKEIQ